MFTTAEGQWVSPVRRLAALATICALLAFSGCSTATDEPFAQYQTDNISPFQRDLLADGSLSLGEMESAAQSYAECIERLGINANAEFRPDTQTFDYRFKSAAGNVQLVLESAEASACETEFIGTVQYIWADQVGPTESDDVAFYEAVAQCMRERGFAVEDSRPATLSFWIRSEPDTYDECFLEVEAGR